MSVVALDPSRRFSFGANWLRFLESVDEHRLAVAEQSLTDALGDLHGRSFLDAGCGSGLFSLAAHRLGASVRSFDFDPQSVECTAELQRKFDATWPVQRGSVLDTEYLASLGTFDVVYSWGVLHHTGAMWLAFENAMRLVNPGGTLFISIYNDQGWKSRAWWLIKFIYNRLPAPLAWLYAHSLGLMLDAAVLARDTLRGKVLSTLRRWRNYEANRGMSRMTDRIDWFGGFPYEFASLDVLVSYFAARGFDAVKTVPASSLGCHELVLVRRP